MTTGGTASQSVKKGDGSATPGPAYPDSLGISAANWWGNGGTSDLSPAAQVVVAQRIEGYNFVPDQNGCAAW